MKISCSSCNQPLEIPEELKGETIECPACNTELIVPMAETQTDEATANEQTETKSSQNTENSTKIKLESFLSVIVNIIKKNLFATIPDFTNCKGCDNKLSTKAWKCHTCGAPIGQTQRAFQFAGVIILVLVAIPATIMESPEAMMFGVIICLVFMTIGRLFKGRQ